MRSESLLGAPDVLNVLNPPISAYPAGTSFGYTALGQCVLPEVTGKRDSAHLTLHFEGIDGHAHIAVIDLTNGKRADRHTLGRAPWDGHYRPELMVDCDQIDAKPGDRIEVWVFFHDLSRVHGVTWPVSWTYECPETIEALDRQTKREWDTANA